MHSLDSTGVADLIASIECEDDVPQLSQEGRKEFAVVMASTECKSKLRTGRLLLTALAKVMGIMNQEPKKKGIAKRKNLKKVKRKPPNVQSPGQAKPAAMDESLTQSETDAQSESESETSGSESESDSAGAPDATKPLTRAVVMAAHFRFAERFAEQHLSPALMTEFPTGPRKKPLAAIYLEELAVEHKLKALDFWNLVQSSGVPPQAPRASSDVKLKTCAEYMILHHAALNALNVRSNLVELCADEVTVGRCVVVAKVQQQDYQGKECMIWGEVKESRLHSNDGREFRLDIAKDCKRLLVPVRKVSLEFRNEWPSAAKTWWGFRAFTVFGTEVSLRFPFDIAVSHWFDHAGWRGVQAGIRRTRARTAGSGARGRV